MLSRKLEIEVMDTWDDARDYDRMDHVQVNRLFVSDFLTFATPPGLSAADNILDLGTGTAQIPIELCWRSECRVIATDMARHMLALAQHHVEAAALIGRIRFERADAKRLPHPDGRFAAVMSNSIVHHVAHPGQVLAEANRVVRPGGLIFFRDLLRPADESHLAQLVETYAAGCNCHQRQLFADSLRAALTLEEIRDLVAALGYDPTSVRQTSDRHWTWAATAKPTK